MIAPCQSLFKYLKVIRYPYCDRTESHIDKARIFLLVNFKNPPTVIFQKVEKKILKLFFILSANSKYYLFHW